MINVLSFHVKCVTCLSHEYFAAFFNHTTFPQRCHKPITCNIQYYSKISDLIETAVLGYVGSSWWQPFNMPKLQFNECVPEITLLLTSLIRTRRHENGVQGTDSPSFSFAYCVRKETFYILMNCFNNRVRWNQKFVNRSTKDKILNNNLP